MTACNIKNKAHKNIISSIFSSLIISIISIITCSANTIITSKITGCDTIIAPLPQDSTAYSEAEYPGGAAAWNMHVLRNSRVPENYRDSIIRDIIVTFTIDNRGNVTQIRASEGPKILQKAAIAVIKKSDKWIPAQKNGVPVNSDRQQKFTFDLTYNNKH